MSDELEQYYEGYDEDSRLQKDNAHKVEFLTTTHYFDKLFKQGSSILDVCAGTGIYSYYLADKGHIVTAGDLVPHNVNIIKSKQNSNILHDILVCNALDLSYFKEKSFDVVLCMGALYHLTTDSDRKKAINECAKVLKQDGLLVLAYINKFACIAQNVSAGLTNMDEALSIFYDKSDLIFSMTTPERMSALIDECNLETICHVGTDGMTYAIEDKINTANEENFNKWMEYHIASCEESSILGASEHGLIVCKKKYI